MPLNPNQLHLHKHKVFVTADDEILFQGEMRLYEKHNQDDLKTRASIAFKIPVEKTLVLNSNF